MTSMAPRTRCWEPIPTLGPESGYDFSSRGCKFIDDMAISGEERDMIRLHNAIELGRIG